MYLVLTDASESSEKTGYREIKSDDPVKKSKKDVIAKVVKPSRDLQIFDFMRLLRHDLPRHDRLGDFLRPC